MGNILLIIKDKVSTILLIVALSPIIVILKIGNWVLEDTTITWGGDVMDSEELQERKRNLEEKYNEHRNF